MEFCFISVDVEGSVRYALPPVSSMVALGACVVGRPDENFYRELKPISDCWDSNTEKAHKITREYLMQYGCDPLRVTQEFRDWTLQAAGSLRPVFCAMPVRYDWSYVRWYFENFSVKNPFVKTLDALELYRSITSGLWTAVGTSYRKVCKEYPSTIPHLHHALGDALEQEEIFRPMLQKAGLIEPDQGVLIKIA